MMLQTLLCVVVGKDVVAVVGYVGWRLANNFDYVFRYTMYNTNATDGDLVYESPSFRGNDTWLKPSSITFQITTTCVIIL